MGMEATRTQRILCGYGWYGHYPFGYYPYGYYPYGYPFPSYAYPSYPYPSAPSQYPAYVESEQPFYWYYCQDPQGYYPYVESCPSGWTRVIPTPPERNVAQSPPALPTRSTVLQSIYFNLNKSDIRPDAVQTLNENLRWSRWNPGRKVSIQGNCDPRATEKYKHYLRQEKSGRSEEVSCPSWRGCSTSSHGQPWERKATL